MNTVYIGGRRFVLQPDTKIGAGGEADVYKLDAATVLKRYKEPDDETYRALPDERARRTAQAGAIQRMSEQQMKLPAFPGNLPSAVIAPQELAYDRSAGGRLVGYTMPYLNGMEGLIWLSNRDYRENGGQGGNHVVKVFRGLHELVRGVHAAQVVIGDFNDLNVLMDASGQVYLVDADSMQFGQFLCRTFTTRFLDPLLSAPDELTLVRPHNQESDWYAFSVMLLQSLLYAGPYSGVHKPPGGKRLQHDARVLKRLTFFDKDVTYFRGGVPLSVLPDDLLSYMQAVFEHDQRGIFPQRMLEELRWTACTGCGLTHARAVCPACAAPGAVKQTVAIRGTVTATRLFRTNGRLLHAVVQGRVLRYLYHEHGEFRREDGTAVLAGNLDPELRFRIQGPATVFGKRDKLFTLIPGQGLQRQTTGTYRNLSMFDTNDHHTYWLQNGQLVREDRFGSRYIGDILVGQTMFWAGPRFGFGLYQAGQLQRAFVFDADSPGLNDQVGLATLPGQLVDATCAFSDSLAWFMTTAQEQGVLVNRCSVINRSGAVLAEAQAAQGDHSWLAGSIRGHLAIGSSLYAATEEGIVQVTARTGVLEVGKTFPDTEPFVDDATRLLPAPGGIYAVSNQEIVLLEIR